MRCDAMQLGICNNICGCKCPVANFLCLKIHCSVVANVIVFTSTRKATRFDCLRQYFCCLTILDDIDITSFQVESRKMFLCQNYLGHMCCSCKELSLIFDGGKVYMPNTYSLVRSDVELVCDWLKRLKFSNG